MPVEILTDKQRLEKWNEICMKAGWAQPGELQMWTQKANVKFTRGDSCLAPESVAVVSDEKTAIAAAVNGTGEAVATRLLEVYAGLLVFISSTLESKFWQTVIERMSKEFDIFLPPELVPKYIREILKYPQDGDGSLPT